MNNKLLSIRDFAKFSRVTKAALLHYDKVGLLHPMSRGLDNKYRYYSTRQLSTINVIRTLQEFGLSLNEIKNLIKKRTPEDTIKLFMELMGEVDKQIIRWHRAKQLMFTFLRSMISVMDVDKEAISIQNIAATPITLGPINTYSDSHDDFDALCSFYHSLYDKNIDMNYPVWGFFTQERIRQRDWKWPDRYYFFNPEGSDKRPAGQYAIGYGYGGYGHTSPIYERVLAYIDENGFEICGDSYEEYPLNEISVANDNALLIRVLIRVCAKS
jgi:DNA-binding transcriptional MerR regulator/effector-binding domain-containing protein